jgi:hypothetical protein
MTPPSSLRVVPPVYPIAYVDVEADAGIVLKMPQRSKRS